MILFTRTVCPKCMLVKSTLNANNVEYQELNVDENEEALKELQSKNFSSVPILKVNDEYEADVTKMLKMINELA